ncbi:MULTISPECIES: glutathione S-transferase family protein [Variovorax]|jgi:glutathione S-transferase|uniref:glutathione S-transferase family protein n=1 Tax=Variovorax TaxID=34072 RepID=UPI000896EA1C|nr:MULTISPECIES: glutathione S-transferase family protein [Variovorax]MDQ0085542.1 glutathione S-transferase [Variovorax boronicumulans]SDZ06168.1 glutathione S-transferase [Variovorax sp. YR634]
MTRQALTLVSHLLCPYVQRAAIALNEKDVPFERVVIDLANKPQWFLDISPLGKVPLLKVQRPDGSEAVLFESNVICEYLEETQPGARLHPEDPLTRAEHRAWMEFGSAILADLWGYETTQDAAVFEQKRLALIAKFGRVEAALGEGPYFAGRSFSLVDAVFAPVFRYFEVFDAISDSHVFDALPKVDAWRKALAARPSVRNAVVPEYPQHLMEFLQRHQAHLLTLAA